VLAKVRQAVCCCCCCCCCRGSKLCRCAQQLQSMLCLANMQLVHA
jgi:hypothetical protein